MLIQSVERCLRTACFLLFALGVLTGSAVAQVVYDVAPFQPVTSTQASAKRVVTPAAQPVPFGTGDFVEVELPVDELGRRVVVSYLIAEFAGQWGGELEILGRAVPNGPLTSFGLFYYDFNRNPMRLPVPTRLASFRIEHRRNFGGNAGELTRIRIFAIESSRTFSIDGNGWFVTRPATGAWTSIALTIHPEAQDNFGLLFISVGSPLSNVPFLLMPTAQGGFLLDLENLSLVDARPLIGTGAWPFVVSFPYDPAVLSAPIHLQAVLGDVFTNPIQPLLFWTRPITIHS